MQAVSTSWDKLADEAKTLLQKFNAMRDDQTEKAKMLCSLVLPQPVESLLNVLPGEIKTVFWEQESAGNVALAFY